MEFEAGSGELILCMGCGKRLHRTNLKRKKPKVHIDSRRREVEYVNDTNKIDVIDEIKPQEWQIIKLIRELEYGQVIVNVKNSKVVHAETRKSINLAP